MFRYGKISKIDADKCLARVNFEEDDFESDWLPVLQPGTLANKYYTIPDVGEHVVCLMDKHAENGVILGAIYSSEELPGSVKGADIAGVLFDGGDYIKYDRQAGKYQVKTSTVELILGPAGPTLKKGSESLKTILADLITQLEALTVTTAMGPSSVPINVTAITAIKTRINAFFEN